MDRRQRISLSESDGMEGGVPCPICGCYTSFGDIIATGRCRGHDSHDCAAELSLDLVVEHRCID